MLLRPAVRQNLTLLLHEKEAESEYERKDTK